MKKISTFLIMLLFVVANLMSQNACQEDSSFIRRLINENKLDSAVNIFSEKTLKYELCPIVYSMLIYSYIAKGDYVNGLVFADKWLNVSINRNDTSKIIGANNYKAKAYYELGKLDEAIQIASNQHKYFKEKDSTRRMENDLRLGLFLLENGEFEKAYDIYRRINFNHVKNEGAENTYFNNFSNIFSALEQYDSALVYIKKALQHSKKYEDSWSSLMHYSNIASTHIDLKQFDLALQYVDSTRFITDIYKFDPVYRFVYENYYVTYWNLNKIDSAWVYMNKLKVLNDSIFDDRLQTKLKELQLSGKRELKLTKKVEMKDYHLQKAENRLLFTIVLFLVAVIILGGLIFYLKIKNIQTKNRNIITEQKLLRSQMTPHFIFNSLSIIQGMILSDEKKTAVNYLSKFSKLMRLILENSRTKYVTLDQELKALEYYLELQNLRLNNTLNWKIKLDENFSLIDTEIPPMMIQPFVENSVKHGFQPTQKNCKLDINLVKDSSHLHISITDNGIGIDTVTRIKTSKSLSTTITMERLAILAKGKKKKSNLEILDRNKFNEKGTIVNISIPLKN